MNQPKKDAISDLLRAVDSLVFGDCDKAAHQAARATKTLRRIYKAEVRESRKVARNLKGS